MGEVVAASGRGGIRKRKGLGKEASHERPHRHLLLHFAAPALPAVQMHISKTEGLRAIAASTELMQLRVQRARTQICRQAESTGAHIVERVVMQAQPPMRTVCTHASGQMRHTRLRVHADCIGSRG